LVPAIVEAMMRPEFYREHPAKVELIQTHISYVFLAGEFVYKLKKAVHFSFLDCTTLELRRHFCAEEIRLNRRLAPDVYLGIYPIVKLGDGYALGDHAADSHQVVDYVLKMRRLPTERTLDHLLASGGADRAMIRRLAAVIVDFYGATSSAQGAKYGAACEVWRLVVGELLELEHLIGATLQATDLATIENYCRGFIASHWKLFNARVATGRVREGHGDLRAEHICIEDGKISIFDCVEFSERLRTCDLASEVAFLAMDLDRLGAPDLADELVGAVAESTPDDGLPLLMPFYKCYRAIIRGMVETLRSRQAAVKASERQEASALATSYFSLARGYATASTPALVVVAGLSGSGKSTLARTLQHRFGFAIVSSDRTRKKLASVPVERHAADAYKAGIYTDANTESTYAGMHADATHLLGEGTGVILDGTYQDPAHRKAALGVASRLKVKILFIECRAEDAEIRRRLIEREKVGNNPSDATVAVYLRQRQDFVTMAEITPSSHLLVDTGRPIGEIMSEVGTALERLSV
jgi:aminoglycoside phosphotransferase family enzyme/predicted kinase